MQNRTLHILNLGAGVQSTALYLMSLRQDEPEHVPVFDYAIFADTQDEPRAVYEHLQWLKSLNGPPIIEETAGSLGGALTRILTDEEFEQFRYATVFNRQLERLKKEGLGRATRTLPQFLDPILDYDELERRAFHDATMAYEANPNAKKASLPARFASIPAYTSLSEASKDGIVPRQCTREYKVDVVERVIRRQLLGLSKGDQVPEGVRVIQHMGLSRDEPSRVAKVRARFASVKWAEPQFPLFEMEMERSDCVAYLADVAPGRVVPRSACVFCPYRRNAEWQRLRDTDPEGWQRACEVDELMRHPKAICGMGLDRKLYLHESCVPLREAPIDAPETRLEQHSLGFARECEGMCGV